MGADLAATVCSRSRNAPHDVHLSGWIGYDLVSHLRSGDPIAYVDRRWLATPEMFAALKVSPLLYERYEGFEYILFYEPDAFVFADELEEWRGRDLDYVGAPWFEEFSKPTSDHMIGGGNGGFSLRRVRAHLRNAKKLELEQVLFRGGYRRHTPAKLRFALDRVSRMLGSGETRRYYISPPHLRFGGRLLGIHGAEAGSLISGRASTSRTLVQFRGKAETSVRDELPSASFRMPCMVQVRSGLLEAVHRGMWLRRYRGTRSGAGAMTNRRPPANVASHRPRFPDLEHAWTRPDTASKHGRNIPDGLSRSRETASEAECRCGGDNRRWLAV